MYIDQARSTAGTHLPSCSASAMTTVGARTTRRLRLGRRFLLYGAEVVGESGERRRRRVTATAAMVARREAAAAMVARREAAAMVAPRGLAGLGAELREGRRELREERRGKGFVRTVRTRHGHTSSAARARGRRRADGTPCGGGMDWWSIDRPAPASPSPIMHAGRHLVSL
jgi:hypothetical protein